MTKNWGGKNQNCTQITEEEKKLARLLDDAMRHPEMAPVREANPDEWSIIIARLEESGALSRLRQEFIDKDNSSDLP